MIRTEERGRVAIVRIDRHEQRNALDTEHCELLRDAFGAVQAAGARAVVVTGEGSSFCAGADFGEVYGDGFRKALYEMLRRFTASPVPIIAAVAPLTLAYSKQVLNRLQEPEINDPGLDSLFEEVWRSADVAEGQAARRERRPPRFEGR